MAATNVSQLAIVLNVLRSLGRYAIPYIEKVPDRDYFRDLTSISLLRQQVEDIETNGIDSFENKCVHLPPFKDKWYPLLFVQKHGLSGLSDACQFQLVVVGGGRPFGFRWEPPESSSGTGVHEYWHVQPIHTVRVGQKERPLGDKDQVAADICEHAPAFPIDACDLLQMIAGLCLSLYGPNWFTDFQIDPRAQEAIRKSCKDCAWVKIRQANSLKAQKAPPRLGKKVKGKK